MNLVNRNFVGLAMIIATIACWQHPGFADFPENAQEELKLISDVTYGVVDSVELKLDVASLESNDSDTRSPCIVVIHGGAWRQGNKSNHRNEIQALAREGYVAVSVGYRLVPSHRFPSQVHDVKQAVRFLRENAATYGIDPDRIGAMGFSAGGHLALMLGTTGGAKDDGVVEKRDQWSDPIDQSSKVQAVVSYFGPTDFTRGGIPPAATRLVSDFLGGTIDDVPDAFRDASPALYLDPADAPVLMFQGTRDPLVPYQQAVWMADAMTRANVDGRIELLVNASHGWAGQKREHTDEETLQFFDLHLRKKH